MQVAVTALRVSVPPSWFVASKPVLVPSAIFVLQPTINRLRGDADELTQKIAELEERNGTLRSDIAALGTDAATEKLARERLMMIADGETDLYINGRHIGHATAEDGKATFPDLELESGLNHILLVWYPQSDNSTIKTLWRNIVRHPETGFLFDKMPQW